MDKKVKWQLIEQSRYDGTYWMLKKDSEYINKESVTYFSIVFLVLCAIV